MPGKGLAGKASIDMLKVNCQELRIYKVPVLLRPATTNYQLYSKANLRGPKRFRNSPALYAQNDIAGCSNSSYLFVENKQKVNAHSFLQTSPYITDSPQNPEKHIKDSNAKAGAKKATKVFLSEKQSQYTKECGILMPGAPPATPTPEHLKQFHYVPSLTDIKAQRHIRQRLEGMARKEQKKGANKQDSQFQLEKISLREQQQDLKQQQRLEIYALNHVMKALENKQFEDFMIRQGLPRF